MASRSRRSASSTPAIASSGDTPGEAETPGHSIGSEDSSSTCVARTGAGAVRAAVLEVLLDPSVIQQFSAAVAAASSASSGAAVPSGLEGGESASQADDGASGPLAATVSDPSGEFYCLLCVCVWNVRIRTRVQRRSAAASTQ